jgi:FkbM family methyltransferase
MIVNKHYQIIKTNHGQMIVNSHDRGISQALLKDEVWAPKELELTRPYATGIVLDVGANIGTHTLTYAQTADMVYAFEPQPFCFDMLCTNLLLNNVLNVTPIQCALGPSDGIVHMNIHDPTQPNSPAGEGVGKGESTVMMHKLDTLGIRGVNFIKMDVEGFELDVLKGMRQTLQEYQPVLYIEIHYASLIEPIKRFLAEFGYSATALILTHVIVPEGEGYDTSMPEVYGFLFKGEETSTAGVCYVGMDGKVYNCPPGTPGIAVEVTP